MKPLVIAVEATSALGSSWPNLSNFVQNVVKSVCANGKARVEDNQIVDDVALSLVVFGAHRPNSPYLVYQTDWTNDFKCFFKWLSAVEFSSDVYHETVAIARGLAQVQLAYDHPPVLVEGLEKHCILVAFSNPEDQLPTAETVAESFLHNSISISLICPTPHPKLEAIYIAAKRNKSAIDQSICLEKIESGYTFLISDDLIEACPYLSSYSDLLANNPTNQKSLTDISPERVQSLAPLDDPFCLFPVLDGPPPLLDNQHFSDLISDKSFDHGSERVLSFAPFDDPLCLSPLLDARPPSLDDEHLYLVPDVPFDYDFETSDIVPSAVRCDESEQAQSSTVPQSARGDLVNPWDINLSTRHPCLAPTHRPSWLIDSSMIATMIRSASGSCNPEHINWKSNPTKLLKHAQTATISSATSNQAWPGLPRGLKFDPLDPEIIEHLLAKSGVNGFLPHPFIDDFIPTVKEADGICYTHPQKLPGVLQDGSVSHFFHKAFKMQSTGTKKRRKIHGDDLGGFRWHQTGRTRPVVLHGVQCGGKKIMVLNASSLKGVKEKTNWVMHLYHLGTEEDEKEGEYVISKVFYQQKTQSNPDGKDEDTGLKQGLTETYADPAQREIGPVSEAALETSSVDRNKNVSQGGDHMTEENHDSADLQGNNHSQGGEERRW